jgi:hypothetical protein
MLGLLFALVSVVHSQQAPPTAPNTEYWQQYAETLAVSRQACENAQIQLRLQGAGDQRRLQELQQKIQELEGKLKEQKPPEIENK